MASQNTKSIVLPKSAIQGKEGIVILSLKKWKEVEEALEDLEMYQSESLVKDIAKRRKDKKTVPLSRLLKKYHI